MRCFVKCFSWLFTQLYVYACIQTYNHFIFFSFFRLFAAMLYGEVCVTTMTTKNTVGHTQLKNPAMETKKRHVFSIVIIFWHTVYNIHIQKVFDERFTSQQYAFTAKQQQSNFIDRFNCYIIDLVDFDVSFFLFSFLPHQSVGTTQAATSTK